MLKKYWLIKLETRSMEIGRIRVHRIALQVSKGLCCRTWSTLEAMVKAKLGFGVRVDLLIMTILLESNALPQKVYVLTLPCGTQKEGWMLTA